MSKPKVTLTRRWPASVEAILQDEFDVTFNKDDKPLTLAQLHTALQNSDAVCPTVSDKIDAKVLGAADIKATLLASYGVGYNHIDMGAAQAASLSVTNTPGVLTDCTADLAITLMLMCARRAGEGERELRAGQWTGWRPTHMMGRSLKGKTLGLVGMGRIAHATAKRAAHGFGMNIIYYNPRPAKAENLADIKAVKCNGIDEVLAQADFISLHCPGSPETHHLINESALSKMKPSAFLINTARGDVVQESALIKALRNQQIAGAGLDVFEFEPNISADLMQLNNAVLLPHLGSATEETRIAMGLRVVDNLRAYFSGNTPPDKLI